MMTLATFMFPSQAYPLTARLEDEGIQYFLEDDDAGYPLMYASDGLAEARLSVKESDMIMALEVYREFYKWDKDADLFDTVLDKIRRC
jgi:hypothetical protein